MKFIFIFLFLFVLIVPVHSAFDYPAYSARQGALGNCLISAINEPDGSFLNPAQAWFSGNYYGAVNYLRFYNLKELSLASGLGLIRWRNNTLGMGISTFGFDLYRETQVMVDLTRSFRSEKIFVGVSLKYYQVFVKNYDSMTALGLSLGIKYHIFPGAWVAAVIENINQPELNGQREELPQRIMMGFAYQIQKNFQVLSSVEKDGWFPAVFSMGILYKPNSLIEIMSGYSSLFNVPAGGISLNINRLQISYGAQYHFELGFTHSIGIAFH